MTYTKGLPTDGLLAEALTAAVRDYGTSIASDPRRVQAVLTDLLGTGVHHQRGVLDAVVEAARQGVAAGLLDRRIDTVSGIAQLEAAGLSPLFARATVDIWQTAAPTSVLPTRPAPTVAPEVITIPEPAPWSPVSPVAPLATATALAPLEVHNNVNWTPPTVLPEPIPTPPTRRFRSVIGLVGLGVIALVVALVAFLVTRGDTTDPKNPKNPIVATADAELEFASQTTDVGTISRNWKITNGTLVGSVAVSNSTDAPVTGRHIEVIPKSVAANVSAITFDPAPTTVIHDDPVVAWDVTNLHPGERLTYRYTIDVDDTSGNDQLATWKTDMEAALAAYQTEVAATPPPLEISSPADGATHNGPDVDVTGTTSPTSTITVDGASTTVNADGTWTHRKNGLNNGNNQITIVATGTNAVTTTKTISIAYIPDTTGPGNPVPGPVPGNPGPGNPNPGPGPDTRVTCWNGTKAATQAACPPDTRTTEVTCWNGTKAATQAACPARPPKPVANADSWSVTPTDCGNGLWCRVGLNVLANDSGGTITVQTVTSPAHGSLVWNDADDEYDYRPHHNGQIPGLADSFTYRLFNPTTGDYSATVTVYLTVNCNTAYVCA